MIIALASERFGCCLAMRDFSDGNRAEIDWMMTAGHCISNKCTISIAAMNPCVNSRFTGCLLITHLPVKAELQRRPELVGRPLIITTAGSARPQVLDAAPEAVGVWAGQTVAEALSRCAGAVTLPVDMEYLSEVNDGLLAALWDVVPLVLQSRLPLVG